MKNILRVVRSLGWKLFFFEPVLKHFATGSLARNLLVDKVIFSIVELLQI